jgi:hypothetical protein
MVAKTPADRYQSMDDVIRALEPFAGSGGELNSTSRTASGTGAPSAELATFFSTLGTKTGASSAAAAKPAGKTASQVEATAAFARGELDTDPKSEVLAQAAAERTAVKGPAAKPATSGGKRAAGKKKAGPSPVVLAGGGLALAAVLAVGGWAIFGRGGESVPEGSGTAGATAGVEGGTRFGENAVASGAGSDGPSATADPGLSPVLPGRPSGGVLFGTALPGISPAAASGARDAEGFMSLFNGRDLAGWKQVGAQDWSVVDGAISATQTTGPGWLMSDGEYGDFEFDCEFMLSPDANSGVFLRAFDGPVTGSEFHEVQLLDEASPKYANIPAASRTGSIFHAIAPDPQPRPRADQWHRLLIAVFGSHVRVTINDEKVVDGELPAGKQARGRIGLQSYGGTVQFRNLRVRELSPDGSPVPAANGRWGLDFAPRLPRGGAYVMSKSIDVRQPFTVEAYVTVRSVGDGRQHCPVCNVSGTFELKFFAHRIIWNGGGRDDGVKNNQQVYIDGPDLNRRIHLAGVSTGKEIRLFVNGKAAGTTAIVGSLPHYSQSVTLGLGEWIDAAVPGQPGYLPLDGTIDGFRLSNTARYEREFIPETELKADAATEALYDFQEGTGKVLTDRSGKGNDGKIVGAKWVKVGSTPAIASPVAAVAGPATHDLLASIEIPRDVRDGNWRKENGVLVTSPQTNTPTPLVYLTTPGPVPSEYDLDLDIERKEPGGTGMVVGFVMQGRQATAMIDSYGGGGTRWGIENIDGENLRADLNPTKNVGQRLPQDQTKKVRIEVRRDGVAVFCDQEKVVDWKGRPEQLSTLFWKNDRPESLFLGSQALFHIHAIRMTPR